MEDVYTPTEPPLLQLNYRHAGMYAGWKVLVCCILLNRTSRKQVDPIIHDLFAQYPTPADMARARHGDLRDALRPLGFSFQRAQRLIDMSNEYEDLIKDNAKAVLYSDILTQESIATLPGVGKYALDAWRMFIKDDLSVEPEDKELKRWMRWARGY